MADQEEKPSAALAAAERIRQATLKAASKGMSRAQAERAATAAARNVNAYGQKEEGPSRWQERKEAKQRMYMESTEQAAKLGTRVDVRSGAAGANQQCQKCFKPGHWTYECKNERVYIARPSRTQLLRNTKLRDKSALAAGGFGGGEDVGFGAERSFLMDRRFEEQAAIDLAKQKEIEKHQKEEERKRRAEEKKRKEEERKIKREEQRKKEKERRKRKEKERARRKEKEKMRRKKRGKKNESESESESDSEESDSEDEKSGRKKGRKRGKGGKKGGKGGPDAADEEAVTKGNGRGKEEAGVGDEEVRMEKLAAEERESGAVEGGGRAGRERGEARALRAGEKGENGRSREGSEEERDERRRDEGVAMGGEERKARGQADGGADARGDDERGGRGWEKEKQEGGARGDAERGGRPRGWSENGDGDGARVRRARQQQHADEQHHSAREGGKRRDAVAEHDEREEEGGEARRGAHGGGQGSAGGRGVKGRAEQPGAHGARRTKDKARRHLLALVPSLHCSFSMLLGLPPCVSQQHPLLFMPAVRLLLSASMQYPSHPPAAARTHLVCPAMHRCC
ncbi:unnamed protein product [Closterium sp. Naga37s-1]|nr:unnamed protein product [Closterium sp. Naga37s-1]